MKKFGIMVIALAMLVLMTGLVMADQGVNQTFETQGVSMVTSMEAVGNMNSASDVTWKDCSAVPLAIIPYATADYQINDVETATYYVSTYSEDTMSNGEGWINYDKSTALETKARDVGQSNIQATKEIGFYGYDGAEITSTDNIFLDGTGTEALTANAAICVFAASTSAYIPGFCNAVESGSSFTMGTVNARTVTDDRFVVPSADTPVTLNHDIRVDALGTVASEGKVSAFMQGSILEGRSNSTQAYERIEFSESTAVDGTVTLFDKNMHYESGYKRPVA
jgi:hypothetical protein